MSTTSRPMAKAATALAIGAAAAVAAAARVKLRSWGATPDEVARRLPGDEIITGPVSETTRAITVDAPPEEIWQWLARIADEDGGWGAVSPGPLRLTDGGAFRIVRSEPGTALVLRQTLPEHPWRATWSFTLVPQEWHRTRILVRSRSARTPGLAGRAAALGREALDPITFVMTRTLLHEIKAEVECAHQKRLRDKARVEHRLAA